MTFYPMAGNPALNLQATTGEAGFALQDATPVILSWTAPNDGNLHRTTVASIISISAAITGGQIRVEAYPPDGAGLASSTIYTGTNGPFSAFATFTPVFTIGPGTTVQVVQTSAVTAGAATLWAEIWGS